MEATQTNLAGVAGGSPPAQPPIQPPPLGGAQKPTHSEAQRAKWRAKYERRKAKQAGNAPPPPPGAPPAAPPPGPAAPPPAAANTVVCLPWSADSLRGLVGQMLSATEKMMASSLVSRAHKISPTIAAEVAKDATWNPLSKMAVQNSAPEVIAKYLNKAGVSSEYAPEIILASGIAAICSGHMMLLSKLNTLAAEEAARREQERRQSQSPPPAPGENANAQP